MALTDHQMEIFNQITTDIQRGLMGNDNYSIITLSGYAGTGKTFLLSELIKYFNKNYRQTVTAPTHKAVKVITDTLTENGAPKIDSRTIHSYLKLKLENDCDTGLKKLTQNTFGQDKNNTIIDILYTDESSMVSDELLDYAVQKINKKELKVIVLVGDQYQLLPVDNNSTSEFIKTEVEHTLNQPVRQAEGSPILTSSWVIKDFIDSKQYPEVGTLFDKLTVVSGRKEFMTKYFDDVDSDKMVGTYTNKMVERYNDYIRKLSKDSPDECLIKGDELSFYDTFYKGEQLIHLNSEVVTVESCVKQYDTKHNVSYWNVFDEDGIGFPVLDFMDRPKFQKTLDAMANVASSTKDRKIRNMKWSQYFALKGKYANVRYNYSSTLHRLQGSTVDSIYLDLTDMENKNMYGDYVYDRDTVFRLIYVGITRARNEVVVLL